MKTFIYGAGKYGELLLRYMRDISVQVNYFVQTEEPDIKEIDGVPVISYKEMIQLEGRKNVYIAIKNIKIAKEIEENIRIAKNSDIKVYQYGGFINDNPFMFLNATQSNGLQYCIVCKNKPNKFLPSGTKAEIFKKHYIIGGGYRENNICPCCGVDDRMRWFYYLLQNKLNILTASGRLLHFAPESAIYDYIKQNENIDYYTCDIVPGRAMHVVDITDIPFRENTFDYIISNHIIEHIKDEEKAVSEIKRVLKPNGKWILSFPICTDMKTYENDEIISPEDKLEAYGQEDHVRLYGFDYKERFENYGFKIEVFSPEREINEEDISKYGFIKDDVVLIATKYM